MCFAQIGLDHLTISSHQPRPVKHYASLRRPTAVAATLRGAPPVPRE